jgi:hypothetical protein
MTPAETLTALVILAYLGWWVFDMMGDGEP